MPRIPTLLSDAKLNGAPVSPYASPMAFSDSAGAEKIGQGLANLGGDLSQIAAKKSHDDGVRWQSNASAQLHKVLADYMANPENSAKETFAADFDKFAQGQLKEYSKNAPHKEAGERFRASALSEIGNRYEV